MSQAAQLPDSHYLRALSAAHSLALHLCQQQPARFLTEALLQAVSRPVLAKKPERELMRHRRGVDGVHAAVGHGLAPHPRNKRLALLCNKRLALLCNKRLALPRRLAFCCLAAEDRRGEGQQRELHQIEHRVLHPSGQGVHQGLLPAAGLQRLGSGVLPLADQLHLPARIDDVRPEHRAAVSTEHTQQSECAVGTRPVPAMHGMHSCLVAALQRLSY